MSIRLDAVGLGIDWDVKGSILKEAAGPPTGPTLDCAFAPDAVIRPGSVNAHMHLYSGLAPLGMPPPPREPRDFLDILGLVWWRLDLALDEAALLASARYALAEGLLMGTTTVIDHHESPRFIDGSLDVLAKAANELGVRLVTTYGATERNGGKDEAKAGLRECARMVVSDRGPLVKAMVGLHASFTVSDETARLAGALARQLGVGVHVHLAEDAADVADAKARGFEGPLERLLHLGALPPGSIVAHGVHLTRTQVARAAAEGLWLVQNPRSNEGNKVGYAGSLSASQQVALGTDGWPSDLAAEREALLRLGQAHGEAPAELEPRLAGGHALASALTGARLEARLVDGVAADVQVGSPGQRPRHVLVNGEVVVRDGKLVRADLEELQAKAREAAPALWERMSALPFPT